MSNLKSLTFTVAPQLSKADPKLIRRQRLIDRLEEQRKLAADANFTIKTKRWIKDETGTKKLVDLPRRIKPWWRADIDGNLVLMLRNGNNTMEIENGKPAIVVGAKSKLDGVLNTLIAATKAGELDAAMDKPKRLIPKKAA